MRDEGNRVLTSGLAYRLTDSAGGLFAIHPASGVISLSSSGELNYETDISHRIEVQVIATAEGVTEMATYEIEVMVVNVLESISVPDTDNADDTISESASGGTALSGITLQVLDEGDRELTSGVTWSLTESAGGLFAIDSASGVIALSPSSQLDYEASISHRITVEASAIAGGITEVATREIEVMVINVLESISVSDTDNTNNTILESSAGWHGVIGCITTSPR